MKDNQHEEGTTVSMRHAVQEAIRGGLLIGLLLAWLPPAVHAATIAGVCPAGSLGTISLQGLVASGDSILLSGTCTMNLVVPSTLDNLTLDGQGTAIITAADPTAPAVSILGTSITLKGFTINGGSPGVFVRSGGTARIDNNTIQSATDEGIHVGRGSTATILNNTIQNNADFGILIQEGASARIGFVSSSDPTPGPNTIRGNLGGGVTITRSSSARLAGNLILNNTGDGILVDRLSQADIAGNAIDNNTGHGIFVLRNSGVNLGRDTGTGITEVPNTTTTPNGGNGVNCVVGGYADGRLGTLTGTAGAKNFSASCLDSLNP